MDFEFLYNYDKESLITIINNMPQNYDCNLFSSTHSFYFREFYPHLYDMCYENRMKNFSQFSHMLNSKLHILDLYHSNNQVAYFSSNHPFTEKYDFFVNTIDSFNNSKGYQMKFKYVNTPYSTIDLHRDLSRYDVNLFNDNHLCIDLSRKSHSFIKDLIQIQVEDDNILRNLYKKDKLIFHTTNLVSVPKCDALNASIKYLKLLKR